MKFTIFFLNLLLFAAPPIVYAQEDKKIAADTVGILNEVVVTATRKSSPLVSSPYSVSILQRKQVDDLLYRSTPEALMALPGVFVQKTKHGGGSPFVRGLTGNQILILVDGIRLNNSTFRYGPNQYLNTIDPYSISRVEVVKGSGSVQHGSDALGGVIQILTQDPVYSAKQQLKGMAAGRYWSGNMEKTGRGQLMFSSQKLALLGGVSIKDFGELIGGDNTGRQSPSGYNEVDADVKLKWKIADRAELVAAHQLVQQKDVHVYHKVQLEDFMFNEMELQSRNLSYLKLNIDNPNPFFKSISLNTSYQQSVEGRNSQKNGSDMLRKERDEIATANASVDVLSILGKEWTVNSGLEYYRDKIGSTRQDISTITQIAQSSRGLYPDGASYSNASLYSLHHIRIKRFNFETGVRYNRFNASINDATLGMVKISPRALVVNAGLNY